MMSNFFLRCRMEMSDTVIVALIAVIPSVIAAMTTIATTIFSNGKKRGEQLSKQISDSHKELEEKFSNKIDKVERNLDDKIEGIKNELDSRITKVGNKLDEHTTVDNNNSRVLLRHNIDQMYDKFMAQGYLTERDVEEIEETWQAYHALGGNHIGEQKYNSMMALPVKK